MEIAQKSCWSREARLELEACAKTESLRNAPNERRARLSSLSLQDICEYSTIEWLSFTSQSMVLETTQTNHHTQITLKVKTSTAAALEV